MKKKIIARCIEPGCHCLDTAGVIYSSLKEIPYGYEVLPTGGCESALLDMEGCDYDGPASALTIIEWMPEQHRASHTAAGNRGICGSWPHNGAIRARVCPECLAELLRYDAEWTRMV